jgi:hypothetical protein
MEVVVRGDQSFALAFDPTFAARGRLPFGRGEKATEG